MPNEIWKDIRGFEGYYQISTFGRVKSLSRAGLINNGTNTRKEVLITPHDKGDGYMIVMLGAKPINAKTKMFLVHRLVAEAFIPNPEQHPCVNHKDEIKSNNHVDNLEWCTYRYNVNYSLHKRKKNMLNKELIDRAWGCLPREFREEVKKEYYDCKHCNADACAIELEVVFGEHNLTSDAEGEEMLCVPRKKVQEMYAANERIKTDFPDKETGIISDHINHILGHLFGSKCLPDEGTDCTPVEVGVAENATTSNVDSSHGNVGSLEPKPAEPQESPRRFYRVMGTDEHGIPFVTQIPPQFAGPYDISTEGAAHCDNQLEAEPEENRIPDPEKHFDNVLKDSFSKERRLNIAVQMIKAMMGCPEIVDRISSAENDSLLDDILHDALYLTDKLMAECEKGGNL